MGIDPPFLYERPAGSRWDAQLDRGFNPRAATQAAWAKAQKENEQRPKQEGPLIDPKEINRHPDSYMIVPYGNLDFKPIKAGTKKAIVWLRIFQLLLRILQFVGSLGMFTSLILIVPEGDGSDWIIRIPPVIAVFHGLYGCWHLSRKAGGRTPASSASYFIFSAIIDAALVPFLLFSAWMIRNQWILAQGPPSDAVWQTLVDKNLPNARPLIFLATWTGAVALGGISLVAFVVCVYLAIQFKKISKLPPDMNPFEENLTRHSSKRHSKHKSMASQTTISTEQSARDSTASLLNEKGPAVPWTHTRNGSTTSLQTSSAPNSPTKSRPDSGIFMTPPPSNRLSQISGANVSVNSLSNPKRRQGHTRTDSNGPVLPPKPAPESPLRQDMAAYKTAPSTPYGQEDESKLRVPPRDANASPGAASSVYSEAASWYTDVPADSKSLRSQPSTKTVERPHGSPGMTHWPLRGGRAEKENWIAIGEVSDDEDMNPSSRHDVPEFSHLRESPLHTIPGSPPRNGKYDFSNRSPRPLEMHPPTPPNMNPQPSPQSARVSYPQHRQNLTPQANRMSYPQQRQPQQQQQQQQQPRNMGSPYANREARRNRVALQPAADGASNRGDMFGQQVMRKGDWVDDGGYGANEAAAGLMQHQHQHQHQHQQSRHSLTPGRSGRNNNERVISSGYEDERNRLGVQNSNLKSRQVSGKIAEEGRAGNGSTWGIGSGMTALRAQMGW